MKIEQSPLSSSSQIDAEVRRVEYFREAAGDDFARLRSLSRFMSRQEFAKLRTYIDLVELTRGVGGSIAECGVYFGGGTSISRTRSLRSNRTTTPVRSLASTPLRATGRSRTKTPVTLPRIIATTLRCTTIFYAPSKYSMRIAHSGICQNWNSSAEISSRPRLSTYVTIPGRCGGLSACP